MNNKLLIGQSGSGKTKNIEKYIEETNKKVIVLDFKSQYAKSEYPVYMLDYISPILGELNINDLKSINAGYTKNSHCLYRKGEEILKEYNLDKKTKLVEETIERLYISWDNTEMAYAKLFSSKIPLRKNKNNIETTKALEEITNNDVTILRFKSMHSDDIRGVTFALLTKLSELYDEEFVVVVDDLSSFTNNGNLKLFFETIDLDKIEFIFSYNKGSNIPKKLIEFINEINVYKFDAKMDLKELFFLNLELDHSIIKKLSTSNYLTYIKNSDNEFSIIDKKEEVGGKL